MGEPRNSSTAMPMTVWAPVRPWRILKITSILFAFLAVTPGVQTTRQARAGDSVSKSSAVAFPKSHTPAVQQDPTANNLLLTRAEFEELRLKMVGMGTYMGRTSVFIQHPGMHDQMIYENGDVVGGFKIISIQPEYVVFERGGIQLWLAMGTSPNVEESARPREDLSFAAVSQKRSDPALKTKTRAYTDGQIVASNAAAEPVGKKSVARPGRAPKEPILIASGDGERFIIPLKGRISSGFGYRREPMGGGSSYHAGVDIAASYKSQVLAAADGKVVKVARSLSRGRHVIIEHADGYATAYFHLAAASVSEGEWVSQGTVIGEEGSTGISTGPHLHFEIHRNGQPVDPALYLKEFAGH